MASTEDRTHIKDPHWQAALEPCPGTTAGEPFASVSRRLLAWVLDLVVVTVLIFTGASLVGMVFGPTVQFSPDATALANSVTTDAGMVVLHALISTALSGAYFVIPWVVLGGSPAQLLFRIQVRGERDGGMMTSGRAIARWILLFPPFGTLATLMAGRPGLGALIWGSALVWYPLLLVTTARSATKQGLHDRIARSIVRTRGSGGTLAGNRD